MKKTAVEWLEVEIDNKDMGEIPMWIYEFIQQAKEMEKEQIMDAYWEGEFNQGCNEDSEQYFNKTFKSK